MPLGPGEDHIRRPRIVHELCNRHRGARLATLHSLLTTAWRQLRAIVKLMLLFLDAGDRVARRLLLLHLAKVSISANEVPLGGAIGDA